MEAKYFNVPILIWKVKVNLYFSLSVGKLSHFRSEKGFLNKSFYCASSLKDKTFPCIQGYRQAEVQFTYSPAYKKDFVFQGQDTYFLYKN